MRLCNPRTAWRRIARIQAEGVSNEHIPTGYLLSIWLPAVASVLVASVASIAPDSVVTPVIQLVGFCIGGAFTVHLSVPLAPRFVAYLRTRRYPR